MKILTTLLKAIAVSVLAGLGASIIVHNWTRFSQPEPFGVGIGVAIVAGALVALLHWFGQKRA